MKMIESANPSPGNSTEQVELKLAGKFGTVTAKIQTNWHNGFTLYELQSLRLVGSMTVFPNRGRYVTKIDEGGVSACYGDVLSVDDPDIYIPRRDSFPNPICINGITIAGSTSTTLAPLESGRFYTSAHRLLDGRRKVAIPERSEERLTAVTSAVLLHWYARSDLAAVRLASARFNAPRRLREAISEAKRAQHQLGQATAEFDTCLTRADEFRQVLVDAGQELPTIKEML